MTVLCKKDNQKFVLMVHQNDQIETERIAVKVENRC